MMRDIRIRLREDMQVHSIMRHVSETTGAELEDLYTQIGWPLYKLYGHAFDAMKVMVQEPDAVLDRLVEVRPPSWVLRSMNIGH